MLYTKLKVIGLLVSGKIFKGFLSYMGMAAIPRPFEYTFVPPSYWGSTRNLIGPVVSEMLEECGRQTDDRWTDE